MLTKPRYAFIQIGAVRGEGDFYAHDHQAHVLYGRVENTLEDVVSAHLAEMRATWGDELGDRDVVYTITVRT